MRERVPRGALSLPTPAGGNPAPVPARPYFQWPPERSAYGQDAAGGLRRAMARVPSSSGGSS